MPTSTRKAGNRPASTSKVAPAPRSATRNAKSSAATKASGRSTAVETAAKKKAAAQAKKQKATGAAKKSLQPNKTAITHCVHEELSRYYDMLDGEEPANVYQLVIRQAEYAVIDSVMNKCGGNQSKATKWLGISRDTLRNKLAEMGYD